MAKMTKEIMDLFNEQKAVKVLATIDSEGELNSVPISTLSAIGDEETITFADIDLGKTKENLTTTKTVSASTFTIPTGPGVVPRGFQVKGTFQEFQTSGPIFDTLRDRAKKQYNMDIKGVGLIKVEEAYGVVPGLGHRMI